jgi:D-alanyl-D-alanine carboxypeptidase/D-alanyl-D-alanine-endopeptidase (penicillin-binding protein 4)
MSVVWRWLAPGVLLLAIVASSAAVLRIRDEERPVSIAAPTLTTPVLAARRVPALLVAPIGRRRLDADLDAWLAGQPSGACLQVVDGEEDLFSRNPLSPLTPASTNKLLTAAAALRVLGADATFTTSAVATAPAAAGVIDGDLWLVGGGDPVLATPAYAARYERQPQVFTNVELLADAIKAAGVTKISGAVVGDESRYDRDRFPDAWPQRYLDDDETGPLSALTVNDAYDRFPLSKADPTKVEPAPDPAQHAAAVLSLELIERGIELGGGARAGSAPAGAASIATLPSPSLRSIVGEMLSESDNATAELLVKELGRVRSGQGTTAAGVAALRDALAASGLPVDGLTVVDGSGLATQDKLSCSLLTEVLRDRDVGPHLEAGLAVAGRTGTLQKRFLGTGAEGRLRAKTGTLDRVTALAGDIDPLQGGELTFAFVANVPESAGRIPLTVVASQDALAKILLAYPRAPDITPLGPKPVRPR